MSGMRSDPAALARHLDSAAADAHWRPGRERLNVHAADGTFRVAAVEFAAAVEA